MPFHINRAMAQRGRLGLPMTAAALRTLKAVVRRLESQEVVEPGDRIGPPAIDERRLRAMRDAIASAHVTAPNGTAIIGLQVTIRDSDGELATFELVAPGQGDAAGGRIAADSPLGSAVVGRSPGEWVTVDASGGLRTVEIVHVL